MKITTKFAFVAASLFAGSAMAANFNDTMVDYPQNIAYEQAQTEVTRAEVQADLAANVDKVQADQIAAYPSAFTDAPREPRQLTRQEVREELAQFVGNGVAARVGGPNYPDRG